MGGDEMEGEGKLVMKDEIMVIIQRDELRW